MQSHRCNDVLVTVLTIYITSAHDSSGQVCLMTRSTIMWLGCSEWHPIHNQADNCCAKSCKNAQHSACLLTKTEKCFEYSSLHEDAHLFLCMVAKCNVRSPGLLTNQNLECTRPVASIFHSLITKPHGTYSIIGSDKSVWHSASVEKGRLLLSLIAPRTTACDQWFQIFCPLRLLLFSLSPPAQGP